MPRYSDEGLKARYSDEALKGEISPETMQGYLQSPADAIAAPVMAEPLSPVQTHTEGDEAFLKGPDGKIVKVPIGLADRYVAEQGYAPADVIEVEKAKKEAPSAFGAAAKAFLGAAGTLARLPALTNDAIQRTLDEKIGPGAGTAATALSPFTWMGDENRQKYIEETSGRGVRANFSGAVAMVPELLRDGDPVTAAQEAYQKSLDASKREAELFPTLTAVSEGLGQAVFTAPLAAVSAPAGIAGMAAVGAAEGAAYGAASEYDQAMLEGRPVNVENIINSGLLGAAIGGVASGTLTAAGKGLRALGEYAGISGKGTQLADIDKRLAEAKAAYATADDDASKYVFRNEIEKAEFDKEVFDVMQKAGPNPIKQKEAAEAFVNSKVQEVKNALGELKPSDWERMAHPDVSENKVLLHRDNAFDGAADDLTNHVNRLMRQTEDLVEPLRETLPKQEFVKRNLEASAGSIPDVFQSTQQIWKNNKTKLVELQEELGANGLMQTANAKDTLKQFGEAMKRANNAMQLARSPEEAYMAINKLRAELHAKQKFLTESMRKASGGKLSEAQATQVLQKHARSMYLETAEALADPDVFGKQGAWQRLVNGPGTGWVSLIASDQVALKHFVEVVGKDIDGEILGATKGKVHSFLSNLLEPSNRAKEFDDVVRARLNMLESIKTAADIPPATVKQIDEAISSAKEALRVKDTAERVAMKLNLAKRDAELAASKGGMLPSRFIASAMMAAGGPAGMAFSAAYNMPQMYRAASAGFSKGLRAGAAEFLGGPAQLAQMAHATRVRNRAGKHTLMLKVADIMDWFAEGTHLRVKPDSSYKQKVSSVLGKVAKTAETGAKYSPPMWAQAMDNKERRKEYKKKAEVIRQLAANPGLLQEGPIGALADASPDLYMATINEVARRIQAVNDHMPGTTRTSLLKTTESLSAQDLRTGEMLTRVLENPLIVLEDMKEGYLNPDAVKVAHLVAPESFRMARAAFIDLAQSAEEGEYQPTMNQLRQIDFVLGFNGELDGSLEDARIAVLASQTQPPSQGGQSGPPRKAVGAEVAQNAATFSSQISQGIV
jgi:hypothetical protein